MINETILFVSLTTQKKAVRVPLYAGIIGILLKNPTVALNKEMNKQIKHGWVFYDKIPYGGRNWGGNLIITIVRYTILLCTLFMWTFHPGYILLFKKEK